MTNIILVVILAVVGVLLLVAELFLLPGFGVAGISGIVSIIASVALAYIKLGAMAGHITLAACVLLAIVAIIVFVKSKAIDKMALDTTIDSKVELADPGKKIDNLKEEAEKMSGMMNK